MTKSRKEINRKYYATNKETILEKAKAAHQNSKTEKEFGVFLSELASRRDSLVAKFLQTIKKELPAISSPMLVLMWREFETVSNPIKIEDINLHHNTFLEFCQAYMGDSE